MTELNRRTFAAAALSAAATPTLASGEHKARRDLSLDEIIRRHTLARGGPAALDGLRSETAELQIVEKGSVIRAKYICTRAPEYRIDIFAGDKHVFCEGLDKDGPWIWPSSNPAPTQGVPDGAKTAIQGITFNLYGLHAFPSLGHRLSLDGRELLGGVNYYVVRVDMKNAYVTFLYFDPQTWMIARRRDFRARHPDMDATKKNLETQYTDFRAVNGVRCAFLEHQIDLDAGKITQVTIVDTMAFNAPLDEAMFDRFYRA